MLQAIYNWFYPEIIVATPIPTPIVTPIAKPTYAEIVKQNNLKKNL